MRPRFPACIVQNEWVEASVIHLSHSHSFIGRNACWEFGPRMTLPRSSHFLRRPLSVRLAVVQCHSCLRFSCWNVKWIFGIEPLQGKAQTCPIRCTTLYVVWSLVLIWCLRHCPSNTPMYRSVSFVSPQLQKKHVPPFHPHPLKPFGLVIFPREAENSTD